MHMTLTGTSICSEDIELFRVSEVESTKKWVKEFDEFNLREATTKQLQELIKELSKVKELIPTSEGNSTSFPQMEVENLIYACRADLGKISPTTSKHAYGILVARMVLSIMLLTTVKKFDNGQSVKEQVQALGL